MFGLNTKRSKRNVVLIGNYGVFAGKANVFIFIFVFFTYKPIYVAIIDLNCILRYVCNAMRIADFLTSPLVYQSRVTARTTCE